MRVKYLMRILLLMMSIMMIFLEMSSNIHFFSYFICMKTIKLKDYNKNMGILIDVRHPLDYKDNHHPNSINIYYEKLMYNPTKYLNKQNTYYITCEKGNLSGKTVKYLEFLG